MTIHISTGNTKTGNIHSFSTLPGDKNHLIKLSGSNLELSLVPGTCGGACKHCFKDCYAVRFIKLFYQSTVPALEDNTLALRDGSWIDELNNYLTRHKSVKLFRYHVSGEFESYEQFIATQAIAAKHPGVTFSVYTKRYDIVGRYLDEYGNVQDNFVLNISEWDHSSDAFRSKYPQGRYSYNVFEYDPSNTKDVISDIRIITEFNKYIWSSHTHCPAVGPDGKHRVDANGKPITCDICKRCYTKHNGITSVYAH